MRKFAGRFALVICIMSFSAMGDPTANQQVALYIGLVATSVFVLFGLGGELPE